MSPSRLRNALLLLLASLLLAACTALPEAPVTEATAPVTAPVMARNEDSTLLALLEDFHRFQRLSPREIARERSALSAAQQTPTARFRLAMVLAQAGNAGDLAKALALLNGILKSSLPEATELHPLARVLATQYQERIKAESQSEKLAQQIKESQRKNEELQEKLNAMAEIEQSIPLRPAGNRKQPESP